MLKDLQNTFLNLGLKHRKENSMDTLYSEDSPKPMYSACDGSLIYDGIRYYKIDYLTGNVV